MVPALSVMAGRSAAPARSGHLRPAPHDGRRVRPRSGARSGLLDEFQRFKSLLGTQGAERDAAADLAQELFQAAAHDGKRVRTLLLSATPYKLYTADAEIEHEEHYQDFLATIVWVYGHLVQITVLEQGDIQRT